MVGGRVYRILEVFTNLFYLNLLWLLCCVPVLTIAPSTTAMFGVVRDWRRDEEPRIAHRFFSLFRENFRQSLLVGAIWTVIGAVLALDFLLVGQMSAFRRPLFIVLFALVAIYALASVYLFPVMANFDLDWKGVLKNSLLLSLARPFTALQGLLVIGASAFIVVTVPIAMLFAGSVTALCIYFFCDRTFQRIQSLKRPE
jgi:uncharacterized membrane protein YesL